MELNKTILLWLLIIFIAVIASFVIRFLLHRFGTKLAGKTRWKIDDLVIDQIARKIVYWLPLLVFYFISTDVFKYLDAGEQTIFYVKRTISAIFIFTITDVFVQIISSMLLFRKGETSTSSSILRNIAKIVIYLVGILLVIQNYGVQVYPLLATLGIGGLAVALAMQPTLSNLFSGLQIIASKKIEIGDLIELENGKKGIVSDITWRNTTITTWQNNIIIVPNSKIADSVIENYFLNDKQVLFSVPLGVSYNSDLDKVERVAVEVATELQKTIPEAVSDFEPFVRFQKFGDSSIDLSVFMRSREFGGQFIMISKFIPAIHRKFAGEHIEIPFPARKIYMQQSDVKGNGYKSERPGTNVNNA